MSNTPERINNQEEEEKGEGSLEEILRDPETRKEVIKLLGLDDRAHTPSGKEDGPSERLILGEKNPQQHSVPPVERLLGGLQVISPPFFPLPFSQFLQPCPQHQIRLQESSHCQSMSFHPFIIRGE